MLDFLNVCVSNVKKNGEEFVEVYPRFKVENTSDLMIRGGDFYAIWNEEEKRWSTNQDVATRLIDSEVERVASDKRSKTDKTVKALYLWDSDSGMIDKWHKYCQKQMWDVYHPLDEKLIFLNDEVSREDYSSKHLNYPLEASDISNYDELISTLYDPEERHKIEWAIGAIISGDSKKIQKFIVMYGAAGTGKSTILNVIQQLFDGYYSVFDAKALGSATNAFALEAFKTNPLVAIQHDGDLSKIEDNTRLNSVVSHELMIVNEKFKSTYASKFNAFLFMGTNKPVKITDAKSGILRRLIDVSPSGKKIAFNRYKSIMDKIQFELGGIATHCLEVYRENPNAYDNYIPTSMLGASNDFYNFMLDSFEEFEEEDGVSLKRAWELYKLYCQDANVAYPYSLRAFKEELKNYFEDFQERARDENGIQVRNFYSGFIKSKYDSGLEDEKAADDTHWIIFQEQESILDSDCKDCHAQYANEKESPIAAWSEVTSTLAELDTSKLHYIRVPKNHIVIDFDLKDEDGNKSLERNLKAAELWPKTYAELSKSGKGIHLHYIYAGDVSKLSRIYNPDVYGKDVEIKVFNGKSSLRRKLTECCNEPIAVINSGLPLKKEKKVVSEQVIKDEQHLINTIRKALRKEITGFEHTKPSIDYIRMVLDEAYASGIKYDVSKLRSAIISFAGQSTHNANYCLEQISKMKFKSEDPEENKENHDNRGLIFYDVEVFPNLFVVVYKEAGKECVKMINPTPDQISELTKRKLVGFNCRRYDNHILYARILGYDNASLYEQSKKIIGKKPGAFFGNAYNLSYTDVYDFCSQKQGLKKWEIELGIHHKELGLPWDEPVDESLWEEVANYCINDVISTEEVFNARKGDFIAREILADVAGMTVNDTTNSLTTRIIFGKERNPKLVYTDLSKEFPGYEYVEKAIVDEKTGNVKYTRQNMYRGENVGFGGYVYAEKGMYGRTVTFDVASMHPSSIISMNCFGDYTARFKELLDARIAIKHKDFEKAKTMLGGKLAKYLDDPNNAKALSQALKIAINSVYGLTSASFDNPFNNFGFDEKDKPLNKNNIVALRGALFMVNLKHEIQKRGGTVIHVKTDSCKVLDPSPELFDYIMDYGKQYGYNFEIEHIFEKICLVNDAVYVAKLAEDDPDDPGQWTATGKQFKVPYVFKTLFSHEPIEFKDMCETFNVESALYLDMNEGLPEDEHNYRFVGKTGSFCPIKPGCGGGDLLRQTDNGYAFAGGAKDFKWLESEEVSVMNKADDIDRSYYIHFIDDALAAVSEFGDFESFAS